LPQAAIDYLDVGARILTADPHTFAVWKRLEKDLLTAEALVEHWLATEAGAQRLVARDGRSTLEAMAHRRHLFALDVGAEARSRGATWEAALAAAERAAYAMD